MAEKKEEQVEIVEKTYAPKVKVVMDNETKQAMEIRKEKKAVQSMAKRMQQHLVKMKKPGADTSTSGPKLEKSNTNRS